MAALTPTSTKNLDGYGSAPIEWERAWHVFEQEWHAQGPGEEHAGHTHWLATGRPDGAPHVMPVGVVWDDGKLYFSAGDGTHKARNLAAEPRCVITVAGKGLDLVVEGEAVKVSDEDKVRRVAAVFAAQGWAPTVEAGAFTHEFSAPSAGPPPWYVYEFTPKTVFGLATDEPYGATRWRLA